MPSAKLSLRFHEALVCRIVCVLAVLFVCASSPHVANAQQQGTPGKFDFYLLDMPWGPRFCDIKDVSMNCVSQHGFVLHGLWPQNFDGTWPVFCSREAGPASYNAYIKLTPDLQLLHHEWDKHGTCSGVGSAKFFQMERDGFAKITVPEELRHVRKDITLTPEWIVELFLMANPALPQGSLVLSCKDGKLTAVEACFDKELHAIQCVGLHPCAAKAITVERDE